jgi:hypothetical protein
MIEIHKSYEIKYPSPKLERDIFVLMPFSSELSAPAELSHPAQPAGR